MLRRAATIARWTSWFIDSPKYWSLLCLRYISMVRVDDSCSRTLPLVDLYASVTTLRLFLWILRSSFMSLSGILPDWPVWAQIGDPYVRASLTIELYISFAQWKVGPHIDWVSLLIDCIWVLAFSCTCFIWAPRFSLGSKYIPRTQREGRGTVVWPWIFIVARGLYFFLAWEKCINWYFSGANRTPFVLAHCSQI